jgi:hypothetical protein
MVDDPADDVERYRDGWRREHIGPRYSGPLHLAVTMTGALTGIAAFLSFVHQPTWLELLVIPVGLLFANVVEYLAHKNLMHKERPVMGFLYRRHELQHHRFFREGAMDASSTRDWKIVMFPWPLIGFFLGALDLPVALALGALTTTNAGALFGATGGLYFLVYELCHLAWHQPEDTLVGGLHVVKRWKQHHVRHHVDPTTAFNVSFPFADKLLGPRLRQRS